jgi:hypothetical protein
MAAEKLTPGASALVAALCQVAELVQDPNVRSQPGALDRALRTIQEGLAQLAALS